MMIFIILIVFLLSLFLTKVFIYKKYIKDVNEINFKLLKTRSIVNEYFLSKLRE